MITEEKKQWLDVRRKTLTDYYDLPVQVAEQAEEMFNRMEELAEKCADQGDFEKQMLDSPLQKEYTDFIVKCAAYVKKPKEAQGPDKFSTMAEVATDRAKQEAEMTAKKMLNEHLPIDGYNWGDPWWYAIPILGPIFRRIAGARNTIDFMDRVSGKKNDNI